jgi:hypothetical protein
MSVAWNSANWARASNRAVTWSGAASVPSLAAGTGTMLSTAQTGGRSGHDEASVAETAGVGRQARHIGCREPTGYNDRGDRVISPYLLRDAADAIVRWVSRGQHPNCNAAIGTGDATSLTIEDGGNVFAPVLLDESISFGLRRSRPSPGPVAVGQIGCMTRRIQVGATEISALLGSSTHVCILDRRRL